MLRYSKWYTSLPRNQRTRAAALLVDWSPCWTNSPRIRVRAHTCGCSPVVYELCVANGLTYLLVVLGHTSGTTRTTRRKNNPDRDDS